MWHSKRKPPRKLVAVAIFGITLCVGVILFVQYIARPATGTVQNTIPKDTYQKVPYTTLQTSLLTFSYPSIFSTIASQAPAPPVLERYSYEHLDPSWQLNIEVDSLPSGKLQDYTGYAIRLQHPDTYHISYVKYQTLKIPVIQDTSTAQYNSVAFIVHDSLISTIALSGDFNSTTNLQSYLQNMIQDLKWH